MLSECASRSDERRRSLQIHCQSIDPPDIEWISKKAGGKKLQRVESEGADVVDLGRTIKCIDDHPCGIIVFLNLPSGLTHYTVMHRNNGHLAFFDSQNHKISDDQQKIIDREGRSIKLKIFAVFVPSDL